MPLPPEPAPRLLERLASRLRALEAVPRPVRITILALALIAAIVVFATMPKIVASVGTPDAARPIRTPFFITNRGFFAAREVRLQCIAQEVEFDHPGLPATPASASSKLPVTTVTRMQLAPGENLAVTCAKAWENETGDLRWADLDLNVCLKPYPLIDYISLLHFRFVGERTPGGSLQWSEGPVRKSSIPWLLVRHESDVQECEWAE